MSLNERIDKIANITKKPLLYLSMALVLGGYSWAVTSAPKESIRKTVLICTPLGLFYGGAAMAERYYSRKVSAEQALKTSARRHVQYG